MRTLVFVAALTVVVAACSHAPRQSAAPRLAPREPARIHEQFTLLPCRRPARTTIEIEGCAEHKLLRTDNAIDGETETIFLLLSPAGRRAFATASRAWLTYRREICNAEASRYSGGTAEPVAFAECEVKQNLSHLNDLASLEGTLRSR